MARKEEEKGLLLRDKIVDDDDEDQSMAEDQSVACNPTAVPAASER